MKRRGYKYIIGAFILTIAMAAFVFYKHTRPLTAADCIKKLWAKGVYLEDGSFKVTAEYENKGDVIWHAVAVGVALLGDKNNVLTWDACRMEPMLMHPGETGTCEVLFADEDLPFRRIASFRLDVVGSRDPYF